MQPIYQFGGDGPVMNLALANGFPPETYAPFLRAFTDRYRVVSLLPRALWLDEKPPQKRLTWEKTVGADLLDGIREHNLNGIIGIGHSFGAIATIVAALQAPERFKAIVMLDPTILPRSFLYPVWIAQLLNTDRGNVMAQRAKKRRTHFDSKDEAYQYFKTKRLFASWPDETVRLYAESLIPNSNGQGVVLSWPREWETYYFQTMFTTPWKLTAKLRGKLPLLVIRGGTSDTFTAPVAAKLRRALPEMTYREVDGHGHLFPLSAPEETAKHVEEWLMSAELQNV